MVMIRKANIEDVEQIFTLIDDYARRGIMLPRSKELLVRLIETFMVAESEGRVVGVGSLCQLGKELVEIRSLGIVDDYKGRGIGSQLVTALVEEARTMNLRHVMALTYEAKFFEKNGFHVVDKEIFPEKVWTDCVHCSKQHCCDEIAVLKALD